jgi:hypothetical protein
MILMPTADQQNHRLSADHFGNFSHLYDSLPRSVSIVSPYHATKNVYVRTDDFPAFFFDSDDFELPELTPFPDENSLENGITFGVIALWWAPVSRAAVFCSLVGYTVSSCFAICPFRIFAQRLVLTGVLPPVPLPQPLYRQSFGRLLFLSILVPSASF